MSWKRLSIEAGAIVLSILLAFAIDASWDERQERLEERGILEALQRDFLRNQQALIQVVALHEVHEERVSRLGRMSREGVLALSPDSVGAFVASLAAPATFDPERGTVDALIGAGKLGLLRDPNLREALTRFLNAMEDAREDAFYLQQFAVRVWETSVRYGGPWDVPIDVRRQGRLGFLPEPSAATLANIHSDPELMGLIRQLRYSAWVYVGELEAGQIQIEAVLSLLERALD